MTVYSALQLLSRQPFDFVKMITMLLEKNLGGSDRYKSFLSTEKRHYW